MRPRLLDLFCGAGGAAEGYHRAGFDVVGVDIRPQPHYPFEFVQADAMTYPLKGWSAVHASPPCQSYSTLAALRPGTKGPGLVPAVRERLTKARVPYVIENVEGAPMRKPLVLCGTEFGLCIRCTDGVVRWLRRHRLFESNVHLPRGIGCRCATKQIAGVYGHGPGGSIRGRTCTVGESRLLLGTGWMTRDELSQAIPPAYTEYVGRFLLR